jgi:thioredoxin 1
MKNKIFLSTLMLLAFATAHAQSNQLLPTSEFEKRLSATKVKTLLDVRTADEYKEGHLPNSTQIDFYANDFKQQLSKLSKDKPVFVYCAGGKRSGSASKILAELGFKQIYDLEGGFNGWKKMNKPIVK